MPTRPTPAEYAPFYAGYVALVPEADIISVLDQQARDVRDLAARVAVDRELFRYAPGKWSLRQVMGHLGDGERVFGYRAMCISRGEQAPLPSFDENIYVDAGRFESDTLAALADEFLHLRAANLVLLRRLDGEAWARAGTASGTPVSVRALAFIMAGHVRHHLAILRERYGVVVG